MTVAERTWPPLADVVPHAGGMRLLDRVVSHDADETVCLLDPDAQTLFRRDDGSLPAWAAVEYMAQCVAAHAGLSARAAGEPPPALGLFLGSRRVQLHADALPGGGPLRVRARRAGGSSEGLHAFDCALESPGTGRALVEARLSVFVPRDPERFLREAAAAQEDGGEPQ